MPRKGSKKGTNSPTGSSKMGQRYSSGKQYGSAEALAAIPRAPLLALLVCLAFAGFAIMAVEMKRGVAIDFYQFWVIAGAADVLPDESIYAHTTGQQLARLLLEQAGEIDSPDLQAAARFRDQRIDVVSTPFLYACFRAFRTGNYDTDLRRFRIGSLVIFVLATLLVGHLAGCTPFINLAALGFFLLAFPPLRFDIVEGNVNAVQLAMLAVLIWLRCDPDRAWRAVASGFVLLLAALFKPNLSLIAALLVLGWGLLGRWREIALAAIGAVAGAVIAVTLSALMLGTTASWGDWFSALRNLEHNFDVGVMQGNLGGARILGDVFGWDPTVPLLIVLLGIVAHKLWPLRHARGDPLAQASLVRDVDMLLIAIGPALAILGTAIAWPHYAILCVPLCIICLHRLESESRIFRGQGLLVLASLIGLSSTALLEGTGVASPLLRALALALGVLALYIAGIRALAQTMQLEK